MLINKIKMRSFFKNSRNQKEFFKIIILHRMKVILIKIKRNTLIKIMNKIMTNIKFKIKIIWELRCSLIIKMNQIGININPINKTKIPIKINHQSMN